MRFAILHVFTQSRPCARALFPLPCGGREGDGDGGAKGQDGEEKRPFSPFEVERDYGITGAISRYIGVYTFTRILYVYLRPCPCPILSPTLLSSSRSSPPLLPPLSAYVSVRRDMHRTEWCQCALSLYISTPYACRTWHALAVSRAITDRKSSAKLLVRKADARRYRREADTVPYGAVRPPGSRLHHATDDFPLLGGERFRSLPLVLNSPA